MHVIQKVVRDLRNGDVVDVELIPLDEEQQQIERPLEQGQMDLKILFYLIHSVDLGGKFNLDLYDLEWIALIDLTDYLTAGFKLAAASPFFLISDVDSPD